MRSRQSRATSSSRNRKLKLEILERRMVLDASAWHNPFYASDVNADSLVDQSDNDALISYLSAHSGETMHVPASPNPDPSQVIYYDVNSDAVVDQMDVTSLSNQVNGFSGSSGCSVDQPGAAAQREAAGQRDAADQRGAVGRQDRVVRRGQQVPLDQRDQPAPPARQVLPAAPDARVINRPMPSMTISVLTMPTPLCSVCWRTTMIWTGIR